MKIAIELQLKESETIEERIRPIVMTLTKCDTAEFWIYDIDATGRFGNTLTQAMNDRKGPVRVNEKELIDLIWEDGQIIELDLRVRDQNELRIIIRDGNDINIVGDHSSLPSIALGQFTELDPDLFRK